MKQPEQKTPSSPEEDMAKGFRHFVDEVLRGRTNKTVLNTSVGMSALDIGIPTPFSAENMDIPRMLINNKEAFDAEAVNLTNHPLFGDGNFFGVNLREVWDALNGGPPVHEPIYQPLSVVEAVSPVSDIGDANLSAMGLDGVDLAALTVKERASNEYVGQSLAEAIGLPDLPYGELAHVSHMAMALYDSGRTFQDLWNELAEKYQQEDTNPLEQAAKYAARTGKIITHPDMLHTLAARGVMLTVMGLLHPLGMVVAIGVSYLCAYLVHSFFRLVENHKEGIGEIERVPVLREVYNASGIKEWVDRDKVMPEEAPEEISDPFEEEELKPDAEVQHTQPQGKLAQVMTALQVKPA